MKAFAALLLTLPLFACEGDSVAERSGEALDDAGDEIAEAIEDGREDAEEAIDEAAD